MFSVVSLEDTRTARSRRKAREESTRARVLDAAEHEFALAGFEDARIHAIADRAQVAMGTLYGLFAGKQEIHLAVQSRRLEELFAAVGAASVGHDRAIDAIRSGMGALVSFFCAHPDYLAMHLREGHAWSSPTRHPTSLQNEAWARGMEMIASLFAAAVREGDLGTDEGAIDVHLAIAAMQVHLASWLREPQRSSPEEQFDRIWAFMERAFLIRPRHAHDARDAREESDR